MKRSEIERNLRALGQKLRARMSRSIHVTEPAKSASGR